MTGYRFFYDIGATSVGRFYRGVLMPFEYLIAKGNGLLVKTLMRYGFTEIEAYDHVLYRGVKTYLKPFVKAVENILQRPAGNLLGLAGAVFGIFLGMLIGAFKSAPRYPEVTHKNKYFGKLKQGPAGKVLSDSYPYFAWGWILGFVCYFAITLIPIPGPVPAVATNHMANAFGMADLGAFLLTALYYFTYLPETLAFLYKFVVERFSAFAQQVINAVNGIKHLFGLINEHGFFEGIKISYNQLSTIAYQNTIGAYLKKREYKRTISALEEDIESKLDEVKQVEPGFLAKSFNIFDIMDCLTENAGTKQTEASGNFEVKIKYLTDAKTLLGRVHDFCVNAKASTKEERDYKMDFPVAPYIEALKMVLAPKQLRQFMQEAGIMVSSPAEKLQKLNKIFHKLEGLLNDPEMSKLVEARCALFYNENTDTNGGALKTMTPLLSSQETSEYQVESRSSNPYEKQQVSNEYSTPTNKVQIV